MKKLLFSPAGLQHTYQRTLDKGIFLYKTSERLMLFTILSVRSKYYDIKVCGLAFMFTHLHSLVKVFRKAEIGRFYSDAISKFVKELNVNSGRKGKMFGRIDSASKTNDKKIRESICYLYNNSVEKKLYKKAIEDRWNFLAFYQCDHPFSEKLVKRNARYAMRQACHIVDMKYKNGDYLNLATLYRLFNKLDKIETEQLIDYIISKYNFIQYQETICFYDSYEKMCEAIETTAGKEHDLSEEFDSDSEQPIRSLLGIAAKEGIIGKEMKIYSLSDDEKDRFAVLFRKKTSATPKQINKFLHRRSG